MGRVAQVDPDQLAALRRLRAAVGFVLILDPLWIPPHGVDKFHSVR
jgi:hypothetical protein